MIDAFGVEYGWTVPDVLNLTLKEIHLLNDARTIRDNHLYQQEKEQDRKAKRGKGSGANFRKGELSDNTPKDNKDGVLKAEQALQAFQSGAWSKT